MQAKQAFHSKTFSNHQSVIIITHMKGTNLLLNFYSAFDSMIFGVWICVPSFFLSVVFLEKIFRFGLLCREPNKVLCENFKQSIEALALF